LPLESFGTSVAVGDERRGGDVGIPSDHIQAGAERFGKPIVCFEGVSTFRDTSDAESLHEAIQQAAMAAVDELEIQPGEVRDFEIARIQIRVGGNPNVKVYRVEITPSG
jgi:hypothetical protein